MRNPVAEDLPRLQGPNGGPALCLVTGATGYIGGRLTSELLACGYRVRVMVRHPERLRDHLWLDQVDVVTGDALDPASLAKAMQGVDCAYYLLHALIEGTGFEKIEDEMASNFATAAKDAEVKRIVYLGGLIPSGEELSDHLRSRASTGEILRASGVPTAELRAGVVLGSGSASFEMLRYLTEHLPAMITPKWVRSRIQPIAVRDVLRYLVGAAALPPEVNRAFDIGGPDVLTYSEMMHRYAKIAGLRKRLIVPVPVLTPNLSSHWVGLVTPVPKSIAIPLVKSLRNEVICREDDIRRVIPDPPEGLTGFEKAVELALARIKNADVATRWSFASVARAPSEPLPSDPKWSGGVVYEDVRERKVNAPPQAVWPMIERIGGDVGYFTMDWAWRLRGLLDRLVGGVGLRRGRRNPNTLMIGETLDFWRVEELVPNAVLRLRAEMRVPGSAWLEFTITPDPNDSDKCTLGQRAVFIPKGLAGHAYWWSVALFHGLVFPGMNRRMAQAAEDSFELQKEIAERGRATATRAA